MSEPHSGSRQFQTAPAERMEIWKVFLLGLLGAVVTYSGDFLLGLDLGNYTGVAVAIVPAIVDFVYTWIRDTRPKANDYDPYRRRT